MKDLQTKAAQYAAEKTNELISGAIAQAYIDGYRDGYRDKENDTPVNLADSDDKYVDLRLPSGTLWAADYERTDDGKLLYLTYEEAKKKGYKLPTKEQWDELFDQCKHSHHGACTCLSEIVFCGCNGNKLTIESTGYIEIEEKEKNGGRAYFLIEQEGDNIKENKYDAATAYRDRVDTNGGYTYYYGMFHCICQLFSGYRVPVRLVK